MTDETPEAEASAADVAAPAVAEATVETSEATTEQQPEAETPEHQPGDDAAAAPRKKPGVHNRIDELTRQKHDAIRDRDYWKAQAEKLAQTNTADMDYDDQLISKLKLAERQERATEADTKVQAIVAQQFAELENEARTKWADYDTVTRNPSVPISNEMAELIAESDVGPEVAYHLGKNVGEAARLARLSGKQLAKEMGRLEARLTAPKPSAKQPAAPIRPVSGIASGGTKDPGTMSMTEYREHMKAAGRLK